MAFDYAYSFLVRAGKSMETQPSVQGTAVPAVGDRLAQMLTEIFERSDSECDTPIAFQTQSGAQENQRRTEMLELIQHPSLESARPLAASLQAVTSGRSGLGLMFILLGGTPERPKVVISRFPADEGVLADPAGDDLSVEFVERVFLRSAYSYKAAVYQDRVNRSGFWDGAATDRQINQGKSDLAGYWVREFLLSDFKTTSRYGTKRLAQTLRRAIDQCADAHTRHELISAASLGANFDGEPTSIREFSKNLSLSTPAQEAIEHNSPSDEAISERFQLDADEFRSNLKLKLVELDNQAVMMAPAEHFDTAFRSEPISGSNDSYRFTTEGRIVNQRISNRKQ